MGKPPAISTANNTRCRFLPEEVAEMEKLLVHHNGLTPCRSVQEALAEKFSKGAARTGHAPVRPKQIWNWFQNRRYKLSKLDKVDQGAGPSSSGRSMIKCTAEQLLAQRANGLQFEAISSKDGAWYDIRCFLGYKLTEMGPEIFIRYAGLGGDEDEWVELKSIRRRSLPCEGFECLAVYPGDNVLCFQEGDEHALYYDARVIDVQRKRHDSRGCRCRFWIRYDHDQFEEVVTLRKVCRRPETDARLKTHFESSDGSQQKPQEKFAHFEDDEGEQEVDQEQIQEEEDQQQAHEDYTKSCVSGVAGGLSIDLNATPPVEAFGLRQSSGGSFLQPEIRAL
ncbi:protein SAWADEE HOMEODOMAIN HOMOLOG 2-like isoform X1 [Selaginella moellendorffii]|uniref:protein SAWADEE HOMEODOMAIN HOMOLOG 2-like isoform X1 n=1 Tax=Selaginella moellendorffii TaxID=88036 RepID=UPI000D1C5006|nr:protein SAWADEE HOMEODOMAIN HOMOLOG 2-like isoform X1 [Selaginella moellendorffii]|eukprot:XP_024535557.1 protein SAWADEE HOMEODOMAIN HOMOLOG 2-like isoform X1 [Selaginella moellendorffii]